jgi:hypothetical protein
MKKGQRKPFCKQGHEIAVIGRDKWGGCMGCTRPVMSGLRKSKPKPRPSKVQFCPKGHDTFRCGRYGKNYECNDCRYEKSHPKFCQNGHEFSIVGRLKNRTCKACAELPYEQFCVHGHDTAICGRSTEGKCKECIRLRKNKWQNEHKEDIRKKKNAYANKKRKTDIIYKLKSNLRRRLYNAIKNNQKVGSAVRDLGCPIKFFKDYIEDMFHDGMSWENWGPYWELDHIKELWEFDLIDVAQFKEAFHYTNYQPLTIPQHEKKTSKNAAKRAKQRAKKRKK